jgi:CheY-like chemotaxis protein
MIKPRFLLVDDDPIAQSMTAKIIQNSFLDAPIISCWNAREAIDFIEKEDIPNSVRDTVLLTDLHMPQMDGFALIRQIDQQYMHLMEKLHVFVLSGEATAREIRMVFACRCVTGFYPKPFTNENLKEIIDNVRFRL